MLDSNSNSVAPQACSSLFLYLFLHYFCIISALFLFYFCNISALFLHFSLASFCPQSCVVALIVVTPAQQTRPLAVHQEITIGNRILLFVYLLWFLQFHPGAGCAIRPRVEHQLRHGSRSIYLIQPDGCQVCAAESLSFILFLLTVRLSRDSSLKEIPQAFVAPAAQGTTSIAQDRLI